ncbi:MAG TPA: hypothetical protein DIW64_12565 [Cellvibrio sp.]|nr:hypothetical protein [Cellvibrio sp.]
MSEFLIFAAVVFFIAWLVRGSNSQSSTLTPPSQPSQQPSNLQKRIRKPKKRKKFPTKKLINAFLKAVDTKPGRWP